MLKNIIALCAIWCALETTIAASLTKHHKDHKNNKRDLVTIDGTVYNEFVVTTTLPPVTVYSTSYWTSYWTSVLTQYSTVVIGDYTSTKTLVTPTTFAVVASSSVATTEAASSTSSSTPPPPTTSSTPPPTTSSTPPTSTSSTSTSSTSTAAATKSIGTMSLLTQSFGSPNNPATYFQNVSTPYYMTTVSNGTTRLFYFEDVYYDTNGNPTATQYEQYVGTDNISNVLANYVSTTVYSTSTSTVKNTVTITTSV